MALNFEYVDAIQSLAFQRNLFVVNFMSRYTLFLSLFGILGGFQRLPLLGVKQTIVEIYGAE